MKTFKSDEMRKKDNRPGMRAAIVHGVGLTMTRWEMDAGAVLVDHSHPHAQVTVPPAKPGACIWEPLKEAK